MLGASFETTMIFSFLLNYWWINNDTGYLDINAADIFRYIRMQFFQNIKNGTTPKNNFSPSGPLKAGIWNQKLILGCLKAYLN